MGECVARIPASACLTLTTTEFNVAARHVAAAADPEDWPAPLAFAVAAERAAGKSSAFYPYLQTLPLGKIGGVIHTTPFFRIRRLRPNVVYTVYGFRIWYFGVLVRVNAGLIIHVCPTRGLCYAKKP